MITAAVWILALSAASVEPSPLVSTRDPISPVTVTAKKVPDRGDPQELHRRWREKELVERRKAAKAFLDSQRAIWADARIDDYRYTLTISGAWGYRSAIAFTVRDAKVIAANYVTRPYAALTDDKSVMPVPESEFCTIPDLFTVIDGWLEPTDNLPTVSYDAKYGYPLSMTNDQWDVSDDEVTLDILGFEVIQ